MSTHAGAATRVAVTAADPDCHSTAARVAVELGLPLVADGAVSGYTLLLVVTPEGLALGRSGRSWEFPLRIDFNAPGRGGGRRNPLLRAMGRRAQRVADTTAGFGQDSLTLACAGFEVIAIERVAVVVAMLRDALARASCKLALEVVPGDSRRVLPELAPAPDVVYLDPMYPARRRAGARPRKALEVLRLAAGDDVDAGELFDCARRAARQRVVVKRPPWAGPLAGEPDFSLASKLVRFDVYLTPPGG